MYNLVPEGWPCEYSESLKIATLDVSLEVSEDLVFLQRLHPECFYMVELKVD